MFNFRTISLVGGTVICAVGFLLFIPLITEIIYLKVQKYNLNKIIVTGGGRKNKELINVYGPSECTCICSYHFITKKDIFNDKEKFVPLGKITNNFNFKILNNNNDKGELLLFGKGVGNGYYKNSLENRKKL